MSVVAACVLPHPPLLLPGRTGWPVAEVDELRNACLDALRRTTEVDHDLVVLVSGDRDREQSDPLGLVVGRSLLVDACCDAPIRELVVSSSAEPSVCAVLGQDLLRIDGGLAVVVLGDGSARRGVKAPGYLDPRASGWDTCATAALETGDWPGVASLEPGLADELMAAGRASWQVLAGALAASESGDGPSPGRAPWSIVEHFAGDPFGVWYLVLSYRRDV